MVKAIRAARGIDGWHWSHRPAAVRARRRDILALAADGLNNIEIAGIVGRTPDAIRRQMAEIYAELGARGRVQAVTMYLGSIGKERAA